MLTGASDTPNAHKAISLREDLPGSETRVAAAIINRFKTGQRDPDVAPEASEQVASLGLVD